MRRRVEAAVREVVAVAISLGVVDVYPRFKDAKAFGHATLDGVEVNVRYYLNRLKPGAERGE